MTEFLVLPMMRILLSENVTSRNVRRVENFFPISGEPAHYEATHKGIIFIFSAEAAHSREIASSECFRTNK